MLFISIINSYNSTLSVHYGRIIHYETIFIHLTFHFPRIQNTDLQNPHFTLLIEQAIFYMKEERD